MTDLLRELSDEGVAIWLDDLSRLRLSSGTLAELVRDKSVVGITSNPTIFAKAVSDADSYTTQVHDLAIRDIPVEEAARAIMTYDIRWACDVLRPVYDATNGLDGRVSIEVDPRLAHQTDKTIAETRALWWYVDRPNLFVKIPATLDSLPAITKALSEGISINVTLIFGIERYREVMDAFMTGLEQARANGHDLSTIASVASFFVSRVDTEYDKRLDEIGTPEAEALKTTAAIANARLAFEAYEQAFDTDRWRALEAAGAKPQRPLWASTSTKDPELPDTLYVSELVTSGTVNTMPEKTLLASEDHLELKGDRVRGSYDEARKTIAALSDQGISYDDVVRVLEEEGIEKFAKSWTELLDTVRGALEGAKK